MGSPLEDDAAFGAEESGPAGGIAAFVRYRLVRRHDIGGGATSATLVDGEKLDRERDRAERSDVVLDVRRDGLGRARAQYKVQPWLRRRDEQQLSTMHHDPSPSTAGEATGTPQARRDRAIVQLLAGPKQPEAVGQFGTVAQRTVERGPDPRGPTRLVDHPRPPLERGPVTDMLVVAARELRDPLVHLVAVVTDDRAPHGIGA